MLYFGIYGQYLIDELFLTDGRYNEWGSALQNPPLGECNCQAVGQRRCRSRHKAALCVSADRCVDNYNRCNYSIKLIVRQLHFKYTKLIFTGFTPPNEVHRTPLKSSQCEIILTISTLLKYPFFTYANLLIYLDIYKLKFVYQGSIDTLCFINQIPVTPNHRVWFHLILQMYHCGQQFVFQID